MTHSEKYKKVPSSLYFIIFVMPTRRKRHKKKKKTQRGGTAPFFVDFKKGVNVTKDLVKALKKTRQRSQGQGPGQKLQTAVSRL